MRLQCGLAARLNASECARMEGAAQGRCHQSRCFAEGSQAEAGTQEGFIGLCGTVLVCRFAVYFWLSFGLDLTLFALT